MGSFGEVNVPRVRQVVVAVGDLDARAADAVEAGLPFVHQDPDVALFGAVNSLHAAGDSFVELLAERDAGSAVGRHLARLGGDGGYMVIIQVVDLDRHRALVRYAGIRTVFEAEVDGISGIHLHPADVGGAVLSLDRASPPESWPWCGPEWTRGAPTTTGSPIEAITLTSADPAATAERWASVLGVTADDTTVGLAGGTIEFVAADDRPDRLVEVSIPDITGFDLGGVHFGPGSSRSTLEPG